MNLAEGFNTGLKGLSANKLRSGLTMLGIIIGVAAGSLLVRGQNRLLLKELSLWDLIY